MLRRLEQRLPIGSLAAVFGVRSRAQVARDLRHIARELLGGDQLGVGLSSAGLLRPTLGVPAYLGLRRSDGVAPIFNLFDRVGGGLGFRSTVTRVTCRDYRGGRLTYDEHDGTDVVCPPGTPVVAAAPGVLVATRDTFFRGGLTACVDHGGVVTQYTHLARVTVERGARLERGEAFAVSGCAGVDMIAGFPWVPPHVHFMVWRRGVPVDPFVRDDEDEAAGAWLHRNDPRTSAALPGDPSPPRLDDIAVDVAAVDALASRCRSPRVRDELARVDHPASRAAIIEDSLHHDRSAWPEGLDPSVMRPSPPPSSLRITLPLPASEYRRAAPADAPWTRP